MLPTQRHKSGLHSRGPGNVVSGQQGQCALSFSIGQGSRGATAGLSKENSESCPGASMTFRNIPVPRSILRQPLSRLAHSFRAFSEMV